MNINIRVLNFDAKIPEYKTSGAAGFDLVATEDILIPMGCTRLIPTGLAFEIPEGYEMQIRPRSGVSFNTKLRVANSPGTIDSDFRGEVKIILENINNGTNDALFYDTYDVEGKPIDTEDIQVEENDDPDDLLGAYLIRKGNRIAQGVICPIKQVTFTPVDELTSTVRGENGGGSTGIK
jgi:dUTP pyrophosphatase